jgi:hypothetical protein
MTGTSLGTSQGQSHAPAIAGGLVFVDCDMTPLHAQAAAAQPATGGGGTKPQPKRRKVFVGDRHVRTVDIHAHCIVPEALALLAEQQLGPSNMRGDLDMRKEVDLRLSIMDAQGIDIQALSINPNWYRVTDRDLAEQFIRLQNEALAEACGANPDRFVAFASVALQFPDLAAAQLEQGVRNTACVAPPSAAMLPATRFRTRGSTPSGPRPRNSASSSSSIRRGTVRPPSSASASRATATSATSSATRWKRPSPCRISSSRERSTAIPP